MTNSNATSVRSARFFRYDILGSKIVGTAESFDKANLGSGDAYEELMALKAAQPSFVYEIVAAKQMKPKKAKKVKKTYAGLNYRLMEAYIAIQKNADVLRADYQAVRSKAEEEYESIYPIVKKWFLDEFDSDGKPFNVRNAKAEIAQALIHNAVLSAMYADVVADGEEAEDDAA